MNLMMNALIQPTVAFAAGPDQRIGTPGSLSHQLFKLSARDRYEPDDPILTSLQTIFDHGRGSLVEKSQLSLAENLGSEDPRAVSQALAEIASSPPALAELNDIGKFRAQMADYDFSAPPQLDPPLERPLSGPVIPHSPDLAARLREANYLLSSAGIFISTPLTVPLGMAQLVAYLATGSLTTVPQLILGGLLAVSGTSAVHGLVNLPHRMQIASQVAAEARQGPLDAESILRHMDRLEWPLGQAAGPRDPATVTSEVVQAILKSRGADGGPPRLDPRSTTRFIMDFLTIGSFIAHGMHEDQTDALFDPMAQGAALALFNRAGWDPQVRHSARLDELKAKQDQGYKIIFVCNHRSHSDIPASVVFLRQLRARIIAKMELSYAPVLGWTFLHHPLNFMRWHKDSLLGAAKHVLIHRGNPSEARRAMNEDAMHRLDEGYSLFNYAEGTRFPTYNRNHEIGMRPFKDGVFMAAATALERFGEKLLIVPLSFYGLGALLPQSLGQDFREGVMRNQPVVLSAGDWIDVSRVKQAWEEEDHDWIRRESDKTQRDKRFAKYLNREVFNRAWKEELHPMQETMNPPVDA